MEGFSLRKCVVERQLRKDFMFEITLIILQDINIDLRGDKHIVKIILQDINIDLRGDKHIVN